VNPPAAGGDTATLPGVTVRRGFVGAAHAVPAYFCLLPETVDRGTVRLWREVPVKEIGPTTSAPVIVNLDIGEGLATVETFTPKSQRLLAAGGLLFIVIVAASIFVVPNSPDSHASSAKVLTFFRAHNTAAGVSAHLITWAVFVGVFFFWYFRNLISVTTATRHLATIGFGGALLFATSGLVSSAALYAFNDAAGHMDASTAQTINLFQGDISDGMSEAGVAVFLIASSIAIIRGRRLPRWLAWVGIVLGVASLIIFGIGVPAMGLWLLLTSVTLLVRVNSSATPTATSQEHAIA
jgi:hypothetical protein